MNRFLCTTSLLLVVGALGFAQAQQPTEGVTVTGPVELHNPHRRDSIGTALSGSPENSPPQTALTQATMYAEGKYLFVLRDDSLFQFDKKTLKLLHSTTLPQNAGSSVGKNEVKSFMPTPLRPAPNFPQSP